MPLSRVISDLDELLAEFQNDTPTPAGTFDELRMAVVRLSEIQRQLDIAHAKLMPAIAIAEMVIVHQHVDFSEAERRLNDRFLMDEQCLTGVAEIDAEHRELIALGNRVYLLSHAKQVTAEQIGAALADLTRHARAHFAAEERLMEAVSFPAREKHRTIHEKMLDYLDEMAALAPRGPLVVAIKLEKFLGSWFIWHMQKDDTEMARYYLAHAPESLACAEA